MKSLFGMGRKSLPRRLPSRRHGRTILYDYRALLMCMHLLLHADRWLKDLKRRQVVLSGVIQRARSVALPHIAAASEETLTPYLA